MPDPLIGITASTTPADEGRAPLVTAGQAYIQAVQQAGGIPVIIPPMLSGQDLHALLDRLDGILLTGGGDIDPRLFDGLPHPRVYGIEPDRDQQEIRLVQLAASQGKPFLGICRGIQVVNVALGGGLYTHIADQLSDQIKHDNFPGMPRNHLAHQISVAPGSRLESILGARAVVVNSLHHQGVSRLAPTLRACAWAPDELVEAVELTDHPFGMAVQWHPEWLQDDPAQRALFRAFVTAALR